MIGAAELKEEGKVFSTQEKSMGWKSKCNLNYRLQCWERKERRNKILSYFFRQELKNLETYPYVFIPVAITYVS
jgi:hypothetical protein